MESVGSAVEERVASADDPAIRTLISKVPALPKDLRHVAYRLCGVVARLRHPAELQEGDGVLGKLLFDQMITTGSKGLEPRQDRALSNFCMATTGLMENSEAADGRAMRTLAQIRGFSTEA